MKMNTVTQQASQQNSEKPKTNLPPLQKNQVIIEINVNSNDKKTKSEITRKVSKIITLKMVVLKQTLTPTIKSPAIPTRTIQIIKATENLDLSTQPVTPVVELTTPQGNVTLEETQRTHRLQGIDDRKDKTKLN